MLEKIDLESVVAIAKEAGDAIMEIYKKDFTVEYKEDDSPLTEADRLSHRIIVEKLSELGLRSPELPVLSEEGKTIPYETRKAWEYYWCVDPIDGTKEFIKKNGEFTVNIALIHRDTPVLGVVYAPALGDMYAAKKGEGAFKTVLSATGSVLRKEQLPLKTNKEPGKSLVVVASKSHLSKETQEFIDIVARSTEHVTRISKGSSLKLCMVAEGEADIYPRLGPTMEWDTAAAHAVVLGAGKQVKQWDSDQPLRYNKPDLLNPWFVVS
jgi:3'(2'), 5'-bisphosphate nucleotidase